MNQNTDTNKVIKIHIEIFLEPFQEYIKPLSKEDHDLLTTGFQNGKDAEWHNETGAYTIKMRELIKKYFPVKITLIHWFVPQCAGGMILIEGEEKVLEGIIEKLGLTKNYSITDKESASETMSSLIC